MTNEELFDDLKQFVTAHVSQLERNLGERVDAIDGQVKGIEAGMATKEDLRGTEGRLNKRLDDMQAAVGDALTQVADGLDMAEQVHVLDIRLRRLERGAA